jgi:drug/metabolite transporter (DMT)-like permease
VVFHFTLSVSLVSFVFAFADGRIGSLPPGLSIFDAGWKIAGMAAFGLAGQLLMTRAYDRSQAPAVAVVAYAAIPLSLSLDIVLWDASTSAATLVGAGLMIAAGVLLVRDQRRPGSHLPPELEQGIARAGERQDVALPHRPSRVDGD